MSQCYPKARERFLTGQLNWLTQSYKTLLLPESYVPDFTDEYLSDVFSEVIIATSEELENKTATEGYANSDPIKFPLLLDPRFGAQAIIYRDTGNPATSPLVFFMSMDMLIGAPFPLQGLDYFIYPNALEGGFFRL